MNISGISYVSKNRKRYRRAKVSSYFSIILILALVFIFIVCTKNSWELAHPPKIIPQKLDTVVFNTMTEVTFKDSQNEFNLSGTFFRANSADNLIILSHGYGKNRMIFDSSTQDFIKTALENNYNLLAFDYRNSGYSEGKASTFGYYEKNDLLGAIKFAKSTGAKHICIIGVDSGAAVAIVTTSEDPGMVDAIVSDSSFSELKQHLYYNLSDWNKLPTFPFTFITVPLYSLVSGIDVGDVSPLKSIEKIPAEKIMLIQSEDDLVVPYSSGIKLFEKADSAAVFWVIKNAPHGKIYQTYPKEYIDRVLTFLQKRINASLPASSSNIPNSESSQTTNSAVVVPLASATPTPKPIETAKASQKPSSSQENEDITTPEPVISNHAGRNTPGSEDLQPQESNSNSQKYIDVNPSPFISPSSQPNTANDSPNSSNLEN